MDKEGNSNHQEKVKTKRFFKRSIKSSFGNNTSTTSNLRSKLKREAFNLSSEHKESFEPYPDEIIRLGQESYNHMLDATKSGEKCMVQKCYVMVGGERSEQFLQFRLLQHLIKMEFKVSYLFIRLSSLTITCLTEFTNSFQRTCTIGSQRDTSFSKLSRL
jgi:hypothetical protein